jgi:Uma2 family endonuclease
MAIERGLMTAEQYADLPADGPPVELHDGVLVTLAPASPRHGEVMLKTAVVLSEYLRQHPIGRLTGGEAGMVVDRGPDTVLAPDVAVILHRQRAKTGPLPARITDLVPALAVEVRSRSDRRGEIAAKTRRWLAAGCLLVWNVDPIAETVEAHHADGSTRLYDTEEMLDAEPVLPGFRVLVSDLFS